MSLKVIVPPAIVLAVFGMAAGAGAASPGKTLKPLSLEDAFTSTWFLDAMHLKENTWTFALSPDGAQVAYVICEGKRRKGVSKKQLARTSATRPGMASLTRGCDVWVSAIDGSATQDVSSTGDNWAPAWSPDGKRLAFYSDQGDGTRLWIWDVESRSARAIGDVHIRATHKLQRPQWTPDGKQIAARVRPEGKSPRELGEKPAEEAPTPRPQEATDDAPQDTKSTVTIYQAGPGVRQAQPGQQTNEPPKHLLTDLALIAVDTGEVRRLVKEVHSDTSWLSPDGKWLAYAVWKPAAPELRLVSPFDLSVVDLQTGQSRVLAADVVQDSQRPRVASWSPDSKRIAYLAEGSDGAFMTKVNRQHGQDDFVRAQVHIAAVDRGPIEKLAPAEATSGFTSKPLWNAAGDAVYVIGENRVWRARAGQGKVAPLSQASPLALAAIVEVGASGRAWAAPGVEVAVSARDPRTQSHGIHPLTAAGAWSAGLVEDKKYKSAPQASLDGKHLVFGVESASRPLDLWSTTSRLKSPIQISRSNPDLERYVLGESRLVHYLSGDGEPLQAALLLPAGYQAGKRYPMLVWVYASRMCSTQVNDFALEKGGQYMMQLLATRGYAVMCPDIPQNVGTAVQDMMKSVMPAIDKVVELGVADADRLALSGQSNGGYTTLALITQTKRFKAAIMNAGFGDLTAMHGAMMMDRPGQNGTGIWHDAIERLTGAMASTPWEEPQRYIENSPIYYLDRVTTPLIIQAGADDKYIVPFSDQVFVAMKRLNKDVTYLRYGGESHMIGERKNIYDYWNHVLPFLERNLNRQ